MEGAEPLVLADNKKLFKVLLWVCPCLLHTETAGGSETVSMMDSSCSLPPEDRINKIIQMQKALPVPVYQ